MLIMSKVGIDVCMKVDISSQLTNHTESLTQVLTQVSYPSFLGLLYTIISSSGVEALNLNLGLRK